MKDIFEKAMTDLLAEYDIKDAAAEMLVTLMRPIRAIELTMTEQVTMAKAASEHAQTLLDATVSLNANRVFEQTRAYIMPVYVTGFQGWLDSLGILKDEVNEKNAIAFASSRALAVEFVIAYYTLMNPAGRMAKGADLRARLLKLFD